MKLLFDENLSWKLVALVEDLFPGSAHIMSAGLTSASDRRVWDHAAQHNFVIVTADSDFLFLSNTLGHPPKVILLENCDYPTGVAVRILRKEATRILQFGSGSDGTLVLHE